MFATILVACYIRGQADGEKEDSFSAQVSSETDRSMLESAVHDRD